MDISYCKELIALADCLNFSQAADRLFISQSTLSKHVAAAEKEAGFRIFERNTARVELTESGCAYIENMRSVVRSYELALSEGRNRQRDPDMTVRIVGPFMNEDIAALMTNACMLANASSGGLRVSLTETGVRDNCEEIANHRADVAIAFCYGEQDERLCSDHLFSLPFGIACHSTHSLSSKTPLDFEDIEGEYVVSYPLEGRAHYHAYVRKVLEKHGINVRIEHLAPNAMCFPDAEDCVVFGVHFPGFVRFGGDLVTRPLNNTDDVFDVCIVRRKEESNPAILRFCECIIQACRGNDSSGLL